MILDLDLEFLSDAAEFFDAWLDRLATEATESEDPDALGIFDRTESVCGLGFVACQQYLEAIRAGRGDKGSSLKWGPLNHNGVPIVAVVNDAANYWKHSPEWTIPRKRGAQSTVDLLERSGFDTKQDYVLTSLLHGLLSPLPARFSGLVPVLTQWRDDFERSRRTDPKSDDTLG